MMHCESSAQVRTDTESRQFRFWKGTKEREMLISLLFNALLQHTVEAITKDWRRSTLELNLERESKHL